MIKESKNKENKHVLFCINVDNDVPVNNNIMANTYNNDKKFHQIP